MTSKGKSRPAPQWRWDAESIRGLRSHLELTQQELSDELGVRQQTISEWETGCYCPRGPASRLLSIVAERAGFHYGSGEPDDGDDSPQRHREHTEDR